MRIQIILLMLVLIPAVYGLEMCQTPTTPNDIPCMVVSTWKYDNCNVTQAVIYNETPALVSTRNFTDHSVRCNFTWNITTLGSYWWNVSNSDSGSIIVEVDETMGFAVIVGLTLFSIAFIGAGIWMWHRKEEKYESD